MPTWLKAGEFVPLLALLAFLLVALSWAILALTKPYRYQPTPLLSAGEKRFATKLLQNLPSHARLLAKIRVADLIQPVLKEGSAGQQRAFARIVAKHVDFVIVDESWNVLLAIELDDNSHERPERRRRDDLLNRAFASAGITLHRVRVKKEYRADIAAICRLLEDAEA
ncbi:Protein of unknown function [Arboricoccus pini]|uniref:DUF2726 domain-containing protein n=1 Tax=Arboricoccus pini TaxID=1963835 RepID=A0A212R3E8_9PROT|nr:DUF2726 domain-containing protein [Arboricoccus pini]SNB66520.1 Protein of unknown function [Arboricoccus pini]